MCNSTQHRTLRFLPLLLLLAVLLSFVIVAPPAMAASEGVTHTLALTEGGSGGGYGENPGGGNGGTSPDDGDPDDFDCPWQPILIAALAKLYVFLGR